MRCRFIDKMNGQNVSLRILFLRLFIVWLIVILSNPSYAQPRDRNENGLADFRRNVLPILKNRCFQCHQGEDAESGVRLDYRAKLLGETDGVALAVPGEAGHSLLIRLISATDDTRMPPPGEGEPLTKKEIDLLTAWIDEGLAWDHELFPNPKRAAMTHWAFRPVAAPRIPSVGNPAWVHNPIDAFVLEQLESNNIAPSPPASRQTLIRRLSLNLVGLPPSAQATRRFLDDQAPDAYAQLTERLLASPDYGIRWGRHWLDVARFAESQGYVENHNWPHVWRYRDWVISSFNTDRPYDEFVTMQIAGDELRPYKDEQLVATGFLATARLAGEELSCVRQENDMYVDIVNATASAFLGLTMSCAQCHDHKFDPISQRDYYRLHAYFVNGYPGNLVLKTASRVSSEFHNTAETLRQHTLSIRHRILHKAYDEDAQESVRDIMKMSSDERSPEQEATYRVNRASLNIRLAGCNGYRVLESEKKRTEDLKARLDREKDAVQQTWGFYSPVTSPHRITVLPMASNFPLIHDPIELERRKAYLLRRGDPYNTAFAVKPGWPEVFGVPADSNASLDANSENQHASRTALARWLTSPDNPLTARVWVNRIWHYHFGRGLVNTPGNFGIRGARPTNQRLLDFLATELMKSGWSTKHIQRLIVQSNTYRQAAANRDDGMRIDPANRWFWRWPTRRLESETIRDAALFVSGKLNHHLGGPSVPVGQASRRRSIFHFQKRDQPSELQTLFDGPTAMSASCADRHVSTTALQSLYLMNGPRAAEVAEAFADRLRARTNDVGRQIDDAFRLALGRKPTKAERYDASRFLDEQAKHTPLFDETPQDGDKIIRWKNLADNRVGDAVQTIGHLQPLFRRVTNGINGRRVIHFAGGPLGKADHLLEVDESQGIDLESSYTVFVVARFLGQGVGNQIILFKGRKGGTDIGTYSLMRYSSGDRAGHVAIDQNIAGEWGRRIVNSKPMPENQALLIVGRWDGKEITLTVFNEAGRICSDQATLAGEIDIAGSASLGIGGYRNAFSPNGERLKGDLGEILIYDKPLTTETVAAITKYLQKKWLVPGPNGRSDSLPIQDSPNLHLDAEAGIVVERKLPLSPLARLCQVILNLNEFIYVP